MRSGRRDNVSGDGDRSKTPADDVVDARAAIRRTVVRLVQLIAKERGVSLPTDDHDEGRSRTRRPT